MTDNKIIKEITHTILDDCKDSIAFGSATKGGAIKVYIDASKPDEAKKRIDNMKELREYAKVRLDF